MFFIHRPFLGQGRNRYVQTPRGRLCLGLAGPRSALFEQTVDHGLRYIFQINNLIAEAGVNHGLGHAVNHASLLALGNESASLLLEHFGAFHAIAAHACEHYAQGFTAKSLAHGVHEQGGRGFVQLGSRFGGNDDIQVGADREVLPARRNIHRARADFFTALGFFDGQGAGVAGFCPAALAVSSSGRQRTKRRGRAVLF